MLYNTKGEVPDEEYLVPLGKAELKREGEHCSIITHGKMVLVALQAADQLAKEGINLDVIGYNLVQTTPTPTPAPTPRPSAMARPG